MAAAAGTSESSLGGAGRRVEDNADIPVTKRDVCD